MPRKAYKKLYLDACTKLALAVHSHADTLQRLEEINAAIVPFGESVINNIQLGEGPILLDSLQFVSVRAYMEANQRVAFSWSGLKQIYTYRDRPIQNIGPRQ